MKLPLALVLCCASGCAWKLGPPRVDYADTTATLPLVAPSTDSRRWYVPLDAGEAGEWLLFVDTGYSYTTCDDDFVAALNAPTGRKRLVRGEVGSVMTTKAQLPPIELGDHVLDGLVCLVRDLGSTSSIRDPSEVPVAGVLGIDALRPFRVELDPAAGVIRLHPPDSASTLEHHATAPIRRENRVGTRVRLPLQIEAEAVRPILDTGASNTYIHGTALGMSPTWVDTDVVVHGTGPGGSVTLDRAYFDVQSISLGGLPVGPLTLTDRPRGPKSGGLLGLDVIEQFTMELDFAAGIARFAPPTTSAARLSWLDYRADNPVITARTAPVSPAR